MKAAKRENNAPSMTIILVPGTIKLIGMIEIAFSLLL